MYKTYGLPKDLLAGRICHDLQRFCRHIEFQPDAVRGSAPNEFESWSLDSLIFQIDNYVHPDRYLQALFVYLRTVLEVLAIDSRRKKITYIIYRILPDNLEDIPVRPVVGEVAAVEGFADTLGCLGPARQALCECPEDLRRLTIANRLFMAHFSSMEDLFHPTLVFNSIVEARKQLNTAREEVD
eukprot:Protomagalhaensia_wolfi_Nauph_80__2500@NODE_2665_length_1022_cov_23_538149_g2086_i0_p1_GENE_NODE_2665_length_1022_cov_23_538149_g2086_i0NODE_2665_length_1022_cov_23_538149_g2086_i0_p1_ORF_typecomplete_len184_score25_01DUF4037/PF13228_6/0_12_NODE_2665_length_1022_cov_23_538149_g2086_i019570